MTINTKLKCVLEAWVLNLSWKNHSNLTVCLVHKKYFKLNTSQNSPRQFLDNGVSPSRNNKHKKEANMKHHNAIVAFVRCPKQINICHAVYYWGATCSGQEEILATKFDACRLRANYTGKLVLVKAEWFGNISNTMKLCCYKSFCWFKLTTTPIRMCRKVSWWTSSATHWQKIPLQHWNAKSVSSQDIMEMANTTLYLTHESANTTDLFVTDSTSENVENNDKLIEDLSLVIQASMAFIGFIGNSLTFITLRRNGHIFATSVLKLIQSQAILDAIVCFLGSIYVLQPPMWKTHWNEYLDIFIRHVSIRFVSSMDDSIGSSSWLPGIHQFHSYFSSAGGIQMGMLTKCPEKVL